MKTPKPQASCATHPQSPTAAPNTNIVSSKGNHLVTYNQLYDDEGHRQGTTITFSKPELPPPQKLRVIDIGSVWYAWFITSVLMFFLSGPLLDEMQPHYPDDRFGLQMLLFSSCCLGGMVSFLWFCLLVGVDRLREKLNW